MQNQVILTTSSTATRSHATITSCLDYCHRLLTRISVFTLAHLQSREGIRAKVVFKNKIQVKAFTETSRPYSIGPPIYYLIWPHLTTLYPYYMGLLASIPQRH